MKNLLILLIIMVSDTGVKAQTIAEWSQQKETQKKYLIQQIAAFHAYLGYVKKGFSIARKGLSTISDIKKGEFNLHKDYFRSLEDVNPKIKNYAKVADIIHIQLMILQLYNRACKQVKESNALNGNEVSYIYGVFDRLLNDCSNSIDELITVTTGNQLEMKDDERLKRIDALYSDMQDKYTFAHSFGNEAMVLAAARIQEKKDVNTSRAVNGIKNE